MSEPCIFCRIAAGEIPATIVWQGDDIVAFEDVNPQAPVHTLIIPKRHIATLNDLSAETLPLVADMTDAARRIASRKGVSDRGYRLVWNCNAGAGQSVFHIHLHLLGGRDFKWPPG